MGRLGGRPNSAFIGRERARCPERRLKSVLPVSSGLLTPGCRPHDRRGFSEPNSKANQMTKGGNSADILALAEFVIADGREAIIIGRTEFGPTQYLVQFGDGEAWLAADKVRLDA